MTHNQTDLRTVKNPTDCLRNQETQTSTKIN